MISSNPLWELGGDVTTNMAVAVAVCGIFEGCLGNAQWRHPFLHSPYKRANFIFRTHSISSMQQSYEQKVLVVIGGGAAGMFGAIRAKSMAPQLKVLVIEKGKPLSKVQISGGGRCNVTNGHFLDTLLLADQYPRGHRELRGSFFKAHGPIDTVCWFMDRGVQLKTEDDGRMFPVSDSSATIVECLLVEAHKNGVVLDIGKVVTCVSQNVNGRFNIRVSKSTDSLKQMVQASKSTDSLKQMVQADYLLIATGSSRQGHALAIQLGHTIIEPRPSLFTFKIKDTKLNKLAGVSFPKVRAKLKVPNLDKNSPDLTQVGPMLVTHWGLSGPVILRLSAWAARILFTSKYQGTLLVDFVPDIRVDDVKDILLSHKNTLLKQKLRNSAPPEFHFVKRFWQYILERQGLDGNMLWASLSNSNLQGLASFLKHCSFNVCGKGEFKDEFVTAGGIPLSEISLKTMESRICPHLFFAGEVLNVDGITGGFNFQNAWTGGYIAGTSIGKLASSSCFVNLN